MNLTAVSPPVATFLSVARWPGEPTSSFLNPARRVTTAEMVTIGLGAHDPLLRHLQRRGGRPRSSPMWPATSTAPSP